MSLKYLLLCSLLILPHTVVADSIVDNLPESLPTTLKETTQTIPTEPSQDSFGGKLNTPEYVVIQPSDQATFSSETVASVASIPLKEGSSFHTGDVLLVLDCRLQTADLNKSKAQYDAASMALQSAVKLQSYGSISNFELTKARTDQQIAKADVDKLKAIVDKCIIKAPFNGSIADIMVHTNETVKPGDPLLKIVNTENLELEMQIPSQWLKWLHIGTSFFIHVNELNSKITATVTKINPEIDSISQTVKIFGAITNPSSDLRPGMSGQAIFPDNPADKLKQAQTNYAN
jgi:membrane fusion protein (multidrug efflux system)